MNNNIGKMIKELRQDKNLTQKELAEATGLSLSAIKNYENSNREPNSKAMVALEKFFNVSGEFLRGKLDKETFYRKSTLINSNLDDILDFATSIKGDFKILSQDKQIKVSSIIKKVLFEIQKYMLSDSELDIIDLESFNELIRNYNSLNDMGKIEAKKRIEELNFIPEYKKHNQIQKNA